MQAKARTGFYLPKAERQGRVSSIRETHFQLGMPKTEHE